MLDQVRGIKLLAHSFLSTRIEKPYQEDEVPMYHEIFIKIFFLKFIYVHFLYYTLGSTRGYINLIGLKKNFVKRQEILSCKVFSIY